MSLSAGLFSKVETVSAVVALIGDRIYPQTVSLEQKTFPLISYKIQDVTSVKVYGPAAANPLRSASLVLTCCGISYDDADAVAEAIIQSFDGQDGVWGTTTVQGAFLDDDGIQDGIAIDPDTEIALYYVKEVTFTVWYVNT